MGRWASFVLSAQLSRAEGCSQLSAASRLPSRPAPRLPNIAFDNFCRTLEKDLRLAAASRFTADSGFMADSRLVLPAAPGVPS
mmetsp:Transcript_27630/g.95100  ORF Transcript_27630/g.95100 Transcript_27630/m.95100 type:complete len:83 (+) Transcript_27630:93-341(+)